MNIISTATLVSQPATQPRSTSFSIWVNGEKADALLAEKADFAVFECSGPADIKVVTRGDSSGSIIKPLSRGITAKTDGGCIRFQIDGPQCLCLEVPGLKPFFIYANAPETEKPSPGDAGVHYFAAGRVYDAGEIILKSGETLYIEAGAVVRGCVRSRHASNVGIRGHGILDGSIYNFGAGARIKSIVFDHCSNVQVRNIIMIEPSSWMLVIGNSQRIHVDGLKQIGSCMSSDGIDICGSSEVLIENCCLRNDDDNIVIKAGVFEKTILWGNNVENVRVRHCVLFNGQPGNVMEIGYELRTGHVRDVVFEDIDVIYAHGEGAVFSIHNGDRAVVENVLWNNIRIEHYWDKLVDFRVVFSRYNHDTERGTIRNIRLKNIRVVHSFFNPGCSVSLISGFSADNPVRDITLEDFYLNEKKVTNADALELHMRNAENIRFL